jgi:triosephosphate isomerase
MIVLNLKNYQKSIDEAVKFTVVAEDVALETGIRIAICPPTIRLREAASKYNDVFAQHVDVESLGAHTGSIPVESIKAAGAIGSLVNHSEKKLPLDKVEQTIKSLNELNLESLACSKDPAESEKIAALKPKYIAVEPPELIGSGISVSESKPEVVTQSVEAIKNVDPSIKALCGAGVSNADHVKKALELGSEGVLLASAFVKAEDPKEFLRGLAAVF